MPLSELGIPEIHRAAVQLEVPLLLLDAADLDQPLDSLDQTRAAPTASIHRLLMRGIARGATVHYPSVIVGRSGRPIGSAIVGFKTSAAYIEIISDRLKEERGVAIGPHADDAPTVPRHAAPDPTDLYEIRDIPIQGQASPYFRALPGHDAVAFSASKQVYVLDLATGVSRPVDGFIDYAPTPDGLMAVSPSADRGGLRFYDLSRVVHAARGDGRSDLRPIGIDPRMPDQYPSAGLISRENDEVVYRVLTSWYDRAVFRDYAVRFTAREDPLVTALSSPVPACSGYALSLPILAPDARGLAARDEATGTTKIFSLKSDGTCSEILDLRLQTGKVAWSADARRIAFAIPAGAVHDGRGILWAAAEDADLGGLFVLDRQSGALTRVPGSDSVDRLTFPEFAENGAILFLINSDTPLVSRIRYVCCLSFSTGRGLE
jgi:hypothetical protein